MARNRKRQPGLKIGVTPRARNVLGAFMEARQAATGFLLSCGVLPELSEAVTERLYRVVHQLSARRFDRERHVRALQAAMRHAAPSEEAFNGVETRVSALMAADTTAAYVFGLAVGLALAGLPSRWRV